MEQGKIKSVIKSLIPSSIKTIIGKKRKSHLIYRTQLLHKQALSKLRKKEKIRVAFFIIHTAVWKLDQVFQLMLQDDRFEPVIIICPYVTYGDEQMLMEMNQAYSYFKEKGYETYRTYNELTGEWLDVRTVIQPDIVFFTNPHTLTREEYYITNYLDTLSCYVPYNFGNSHLMELFHNQPFQNLLWKLFAETDLHKRFSEEFAQNKGANVVTTGFPGTDIFLDTSYLPKDTWKNSDEKRKRIIWAPHHTIDDDKSFLSFSSFLEYSDFMLELAEKYKDSIQLAFKPHPILKSKLYLHPDWGKEKTDVYYNTWIQLENGQLEDGNYADLFITSDAMIHDSGSFLIEYLYVGKPVLRTDRDDTITDRLNEFGVLAYNMHYHARSKKDIEDFIQDVICGVDTMKEQRIIFRQKYLMPPNHCSASENIMNEIKLQLG